MKRFAIHIISVFSLFSLSAQNEDSIKIKEFSALTIEAIAARNAIGRLEPISGTYIFSGKKNEVISLTQSDANLTDKTGRQIFAKVPGIFVYDMDGAGNQVNISARGLDPHRGWEFNIRKDGIITNSDMYGYPASHYSVPMESIERIELLRGTGSLQYGAQFGGMLNYVSKQADSSKPISFESYNSIGSFDLLSSYNAIGGKKGDIRYYAYFSKKSRGGYRGNEHTNYDAEGITLAYEPSKNFSLRLEWARSSYLYRIPGPLTDAMFKENPTQSTRSRNFYSPSINVPSLTLKWNLSDHLKLQLISSAVLGARNSVLFDKPANVRDTINAITLQYNNRQVDIDRFNSYTQELRLIQQYKLGKYKSSLAAGAQLMNNDLHRTQLGKGSTGSDYDLRLVDPNWGRDLHFKTVNIACFAENNFVLRPNLSINAGARFEMGESKMSGKINYYPDNKVPVNIKHMFPLLGISFNYKPADNSECYGGISQVYRPMIFKDIIPASTYEKVDENIKDAKGYNAEIGFRGTWKFLKWDLTGFLLQYNNRFGTLALTDNNGNFYTYRTNIGNSMTKGLELFVQGNWELNQKSLLTLFTSTSLMDGRYSSGIVKSGNKNIEIKGNKIESVPNVISRNGLTWQYRKCSITAQYSYTAESFADALNTLTPVASGALGLVPSYGLFDINASYRISNNIQVKAGINNCFNKQYFTKRPLFYPGPGVWPSDGRNASVTIIFKY